MRRLVAVAALAAAAFGAAPPASADCVGVGYAGVCAGGCTDMCHLNAYVYCEVPQLGLGCARIGVG